MARITKQEYLEMCKTKEGRDEIVRSLSNLMNNRGWQILEMYTEELTETLERKLHNIEVELTPEEFQKIRLRLYDIKDIMGMPKTLATELPKVKDIPVVGDVYN